MEDEMNKSIRITVIPNTDDDDAHGVQVQVNELSANGWLIDYGLSTPTRIVMQKWVPNEDPE
jgi:hypothetical protein